jgi:outer membrane protein TolC
VTAIFLRWGYFIILYFLCLSVQAQTDSTRYFSIDQFFTAVLENHPVAKQAGLLSEAARQEIRLAKGNFDPKLEGILESKEFQDKSYYSKIDGYVSIPTRSPVTPKIGFEQNKGELLNAIDRIPGDRQFLAGISLPVGRGLITDERRTTLKQAELLTSLAEAEKVKVINKLLLEAAKEYWNWYYATQSYQLLTQANQLSKDIFERVVTNHQQGEASVLDTVQAKINWQSRIIEQQEASLQLQNSLIKISNFLWDENVNPVQLKESAIPQSPEIQSAFTPAETNRLLDLVSENHPELIKQQLKIQQLEFDKNLAREFLKPRLDLNYTLLSQPGTAHVFDPANDYKFGLDFSMPIFLRKERSKLALTGIKIKSTGWELSQQEREIMNETVTAINEVNNTAALIKQQQSMVESYHRLMQGELLNLENGESDLFKINVQQEKLIQQELKLLKLKSEFAKQRYYVYWSAGVKNLASN